MVASLGLCLPALAQNAPVHVKMIRVVDGDSTVIEKDLDESQLPDLEKELGNVTGKNVKVMMFTDKGDAKGRLKPGDHFFLSNDSLPGGCKMIRREIINGSDTMVFTIPDMKNSFLMIDSLTKGNAFMFRFPEDNDDFFDMKLPGDSKDLFQFRFPADSSFNFMIPDQAEIEKLANGNGFSYDYKIEDDNGKQRVIVRSIGPDSTGKVVIKKFEGKPGDEFTDDVLIASPNGKTVRKVIVTTRVRVEDMDDAKKTSPKNDKSDAFGEMKFYPNPSDGKFNMDIDVKGKQPVVITIHDMSGKQLYKEEVKGEGRHSTSFDLSNEGKGTYIIDIRQGKTTTTKKIVVE